MRVSWKIASVTAGSTRWRQPLGDSRPVVQPPRSVTSPRPKLGSQPNCTEKIRISTMPIRNVGSDTPSSEKVMNT